VLRYGAEALDLPARPRAYRYVYPGQLPNLDLKIVRERMAVAQERSGDLPTAFAYRRAVFEQSAGFQEYLAALQMARRLGKLEARRYTAQVVADLQAGGQRRPLLCQVYLYDGDYESAYGVVQDLDGYGALDELKLVAKAHVLAAFHGQKVEGEHLPKVRTSLEDSITNEYARFLRDHLPMPDLTVANRAEYALRAEHLYAAILETHVAAGSKRYPTAAYYAALLAEIAIQTGRVEAFEAWYDDLLTRHKRKWSLRGVLDVKVRAVLQR
jgi:hypothetical protein